MHVKSECIQTDFIRFRNGEKKRGGGGGGQHGNIAGYAPALHIFTPPFLPSLFILLLLLPSSPSPCISCPSLFSSQPAKLLGVSALDSLKLLDKGDTTLIA